MGEFLLCLLLYNTLWTHGVMFSSPYLQQCGAELDTYLDRLMSGAITRAGYGLGYTATTVTGNMTAASRRFLAGFLVGVSEDNMRVVFTHLYADGAQTRARFR